jgi:glycosyltransferase involved in cell wall biosynthesis
MFDIPNAVAPGYFDLARQPDDGRFLFAGRISLGKGLMDLVKAVGATRHSVRRVILAGAAPDPSFESRMRSAISLNGLEGIIEMPGMLDEDLLRKEFARATALVLPSYQETAPMVIQQAMAAGLPVIATRVGGIPDLIESGWSGLLCDAGDHVSLARHLETLATNPVVAKEIAANARAVAEKRFRAEKVASATLSAYQAILGST